MGCASSKGTVTVVNVATATRAEPTKKDNTVVQEASAQYNAPANDEEHNSDIHQGSHEKAEEEKAMEEPKQPAVQDTAAENAEDQDGDAPASSETMAKEQVTEEPGQIETPIVQDTANDEERLSRDKTKDNKETEVDEINQAVHQHDWMAAVSEPEREGWLTTCSMCGTKDDVIVVPPMTKTTDGLMTYDVGSAEGDVTHVVCKPKPHSDEDTYAQLDAHALNADRSLNSDFTELVTYLLQPARTDLEKARVLFRWITAQDLVNMEFVDVPEKETPEWYLREIKMDRKSHDSLLAKMCSLAGLQHKIVRGYAKAVKCYPGTKLTSKDNGVWLKVLINGRWGIIDAAWGSHHVIDDLDKRIKDLEQVYAFDEFHFLPNPRHFLSAHLPNDDKHQFLSTPAPFADFEPHVKCGPYFFFHQLKLLSHHHGLVPTENGKAVIYIGFKPEHYSTIKFTSHMQTMDRQSTWKDKKLDQFVRQERKRDAVVFIIKPPEKGRFLLDIFFRIEGVISTKHACEYAIDCEQAIREDKNVPLPEWQGAWGPGVNVLSKGVVPLSHPTHVVECPEGRGTIQFSLPEEMKFSTTLFETTTEEEHLNRYVAHEVVDGVATFNVINPSKGNLGLTIYAKGQEDERKTHLCTYLASTDSPSDEVPFPSVANGQFGPCLPHFSEIGMSTRGHASAFIESEDGQLQIGLNANKLLTVSYDLTWETLEEEINMDNYCYSEIRDGEVYFWLRLPRVGKYKLAVYAEENDHKGSLRNVYNYCINCTGITEDVTPFPPVNGEQWGQFSRCAKLGLTPTSHPTGFIEAEEELEIVLDSTKSLEFLHDFKFWSSAEGKEEALDDFCCHKVLKEGKRTAVLVRFPHEGEYVLQLYAMEIGQGRTYNNVVNYLILCKKSAAGCVGFPKVWCRRWGPLYPVFSSMGLSLASHTDPMIHSRTGALQISLNRSKPLQFLVRLYHCEDGQKTSLQNNVFIQDDLGEEGKMTARVLMPHTGDYKLQISVKEAGGNNSYTTVINFLIHCSSAVQGSLEFPESFSNWGPGYQVYEPQRRALPVGKETHFKVAIPDAVDVATISPDGKWSHLTKQEDGTWEGDVKIPGEDFMGKVIQLSAKKNDGKNSYWTILQYVVGEDSSPVPIIWEGDEVAGVQDGSKDEEEPKPLTDREQEDSKYEEKPRSPSNVQDEPKDEEEPRSPTGGEQDGSKEEEQLKSPTEGEQDGSKEEEQLKSPTEGEQDGSKEEEQLKSPTEGEQDGSKEEEQLKSPTEGEQDGSKEEEQLKSPTEGEQDGSKEEEQLKSPTEGEQDGSKEEEQLKSPTEGEQDGSKEEQPKPPHNGEDEPQDEEENDKPRDEEDTKSTTEEEENESRKEEDSRPSNDEGQHDSRDEEKVKNLPDGEQDESTDEGEPPTDDEDDSTGDEGDSDNEDELHQPINGQEDDYKVILRQHQATIEETMDPMMVIPRLEQEGFVDDEEAKELLLMVPENLPEVNRNVLTVVRREGEDAFVILRDVMKETGQDKITEVIQDVVIVVPDNAVDKLRKKLSEATIAKNKGRLEQIMAECREHGMEEDDDIFREAQRTLNLIEARQGLTKAIKTRNRDQLQAALKAAQPFRKELRKHTKEAKEILNKIKRLENLRHEIMDMNQATIAEIKTYNNPPPAVYKVMMATFLLLGNTMAQVNDWNKLLVLIGKTGKQSLKRRVKNCEPANISPETAAEAKLCLGDLSLDGVRDQSSGAATFYVWSVGTISEVEEMALNKQDTKSTR
ncbi:uncharacterized protein LOC144917815 [Branchiostoma floridae x Branchiostoma belcheri]